jgi:hypothetical protein
MLPWCHPDWKNEESFFPLIVIFKGNQPFLLPMDSIWIKSKLR